MISHYYALEKECSKTVVHISFFSPLTLTFSYTTLYENLHIPENIFTVLLKGKKKKKASGHSYTLVKEKVKDILNV